jgi:hypothetical protein
MTSHVETEGRLMEQPERIACEHPEHTCAECGARMALPFKEEPTLSWRESLERLFAVMH